MAESSKTRLGRYELLLPPVGEGSEGLLYKAHCVENGDSGIQCGEPVALKRLRHVGREMRPDRFQRQAELLRRLNHPNIVRHKDSFVWRDEESEENPEVYCLVTEWLEGQTLKSLIEQSPGGIVWEKAGGILLQVLQALIYASTERVVHRDLKPSNIYLVHDATGQVKVKLIDFGIARPTDAEATTTTTTVSFEGTWHWMAPDFVRLQEDSFRGDEQSDIYSFGVCFYQVLTGKFPYGPTGENPQFAYFQRWLAATPPKMVPHPNLNVLKGARSCIQKCLEVDRGKRYRSFEELLEAFTKIKYRQLRHAPEAYEYRCYLGQGGFGQVFRGKRMSDARDVAIKELIAGQHARRFVKEAKILQKAPHKHLVEYLDFIEVQASHLGDDPKYFLVLEYLEGMPGASLRERLRNSDSELDLREVLILFQGYLECLEHLHQHPDGIIHRDIKPGNLYAPPGAPENAKLFDLGIAHEEEGTKTHGQVPGTLDYMPPEFAAPDCVRGSPQSDIYSLAVTLYEALTKTLPFPRLPSGEKAWVEYITRSLQRAECSFDHQVFAEYPELVSLLRPALAHDPQQRYPNAKAMRDEIQTILNSWACAAEAFETAMAAARAAFQRDDLSQAAWHARQALEFKPRLRSAEQLLDQVRRRRQELCESAVNLARAAWDQKNFREAQRQAELALNHQPGDAAAEQLLSDLRQFQSEIYERALAAAQAAWKEKDYSEAQLQAERALSVRPDDLAASQLLTQVRDERLRQEEAARQRAALLTIQIPLEPSLGQVTSLVFEEPATAPTMDGPALVPYAEASDASTLGHSKSSHVGVPGQEPQPARRLGRRIWLPVAVTAGSMVVAGILFRFYSSGTSASLPAADQTLAVVAVLRDRLPDLLSNNLIVTEPVLKQAFTALPAVESISARDLPAVERALAQWWTNPASLSTNLEALPLSDQLQKRVRNEPFATSFPGLSNALQNLEKACGYRRVTSSNLVRVRQEWNKFRLQASATPDLAAWREYSVSSNLMLHLIERDFEQHLLEALGGDESDWTVDQFGRVFSATQAEMLGRLSGHYYQPPEKLRVLAKYKADPAAPEELRQHASAALMTEVRELEDAAHHGRGSTYSSWKKRLQANYAPRPGTQLIELPSLLDIGLVERNLSDVSKTGRSTSARANEKSVENRVQKLQADLASLRKQVEGLNRAAEAGLVSRENLVAAGNKLASNLRSIQESISNLSKEARSSTGKTAEASRSGTKD